MLNKASFITFFMLITTMALVSYKLMVFGKKDVTNFLQWKNQEKTPKHCPPIHQVKKDVQKDLFLHEDGEQRHVQILHNGSFLTYSSDTGAHEELYGIEGYVHENRADGVCDMRKFTSDRGTYSLSDHKFRTEEVLITFIQGNEKNAMRGKAKSVELSLEDKDLRMRAEHFRVTIPKERAHAIFD